MENLDTMRVKIKTLDSMENQQKCNAIISQTDDIDRFGSYLRIGFGIYINSECST